MKWTWGRVGLLTMAGYLVVASTLVSSQSDPGPQGNVMASFIVGWIALAKEPPSTVTVILGLVITLFVYALNHHIFWL